MTKHVAVIGAGPGLSMAIARIAGAAGYSVTLLARNAERLGGLTSALQTDGVDADWLAVDISDHVSFRTALRELNARNPIDVAVFQPTGTSSEIIDVLQATVENVRPNLELLTLGAVATAEVLVKPMIDRGSGALVFVGGGSSQLPLRFFGNLGPAMAGVRAFSRTLDRALRGTGVHSGYLTLAAMIADADTADLSQQQVRVESVAAAVWQLVKGGDSHDILVAPEVAA